MIMEAGGRFIDANYNTLEHSLFFCQRGRGKVAEAKLLSYHFAGGLCCTGILNDGRSI
jgi:hypothetical protein